MPAPDVAELVQRHLECLYVIDSAGDLESVNDLELSRPPRLALVRSAAGPRCLVSAAVPADVRGELLTLAAEEPIGAELSQWPQHRDRYRQILERHAPIAGEHAGPAFVLTPRPCGADNPAIVLEAPAPELLRPHFAWLERELAEVRPVTGVVEDGALVSACHCPRRPASAMEAGVETAPAYRRRGHARAVTARWAVAIHERGRVPLYSTSWDNAASRAVAASLDARAYAVDFSLG